MTDVRDTNPNIVDGPAPLETLYLSQLRRFGDFRPDTSDGDVALLMLEFANDIIDDIRNHPYWDATDLDYYVSTQDARPIPDRIIQAGLLYYYADQQDSEKAPRLAARYYMVMNQELWNRLNTVNTTDGGGDRSVVIQMRPMDSPINQSVINGQQKSE